MIKRWTAACLICIMILCAAGFAAAREEALSGREMRVYADSLLERALASQPMNDPESEEALSEDGYAFVYDFATLYAEEPALTADPQSIVCLVTDPEEVAFRGQTADTWATAWMALFRNDNPSLDGSREEALLYLDGSAETGFLYGRMLRDGQRIRAVEYGSVEIGEGGGKRYSAAFSVESGFVTGLRLEIRALDQADTEWIFSLYEQLEALHRETGYTQVATSQNGLELTAMDESDLTVNGRLFLDLQPGSFEGVPDDLMMEDEDGRWLRVIEGDGFSAVFSCDATGQNARIVSYTVLNEAQEGPRGIRLGDLFHEDFNRFRNGENESDGATELLYGTEGVAPWGYASYADGDGMTLRYITAVHSGQNVELYLHYVANTLTEMILHTIN